ncbi:hypothetical protein HLRTI_003373 [Halorhabdus tiamatea SARL4B]|uniref:Uncharacterized protein n=1 Tax=Halorhabdus tiamatea SARL4B TaxID=1033806 RepID=U2DEY0_9EURY|nr:hypothetical protein HLRTI_003373 [Halorhabdus tiamatea SARL4B]
MLATPKQTNTGTQLVPMVGMTWEITAMTKLAMVVLTGGILRVGLVNGPGVLGDRTVHVILLNLEQIHILGSEGVIIG